MKFKAILLFSFLIIGMSSCAYKTCHTYSKQDVKKVKTSEEMVLTAKR
ncbi:hypothetical protein R9C00_19810 [Flammeovirgaceae bacterium SG7u.111]|nr:hypothetical protein [Flammeovirgaceae bacterium SG7u.132]WPO33948.1 hypothetical protein R9C00_19810 [Flammeovirgaceae bacterium SG7u.111]